MKTFFLKKINSRTKTNYEMCDEYVIKLPEKWHKNMNNKRVKLIDNEIIKSQE